MRGPTLRIATPAFAIALITFVSLAWILIADLGCTLRAGNGSLLQACESKPLAYEVFPNPILYFLELTDLARVFQIILLVAIDLVMIALLLRLSVMRRQSWIATLISLILFIIISEIFAFVAVFIYLTV